MPEVKIARFVDMKACESIFSDYSTFVLRSSEHYKRYYETNRGDDRELEVRLKGGGSAETTGFVLSCWTMLDGDEPTREEWNIFQDSVVSIISTPSKVCTFLKGAFEIVGEEMQGGRKLPFWFVWHNPVQYADEVDEEITPNNIMDITVFTKRLKFTNQKEYRFALPYDREPHVIDSYIFCGGVDYMEKRFTNPEIVKKDKEKLLSLIDTARCGYGDFENKERNKIIANVDILFE